MQLGGILKGIRVLDITQNVAGPFCTQILGDLGADVLKIERPDGGDDTRAWRPPAVGPHSATFLALNRNKRSIAVDLSTPAGQEIVRKLAGEHDIVIHAMRPGTAESKGLGYEDLSSARADLVYCAISAFGEVGPLKDLPGYDPLLQAFSGVMSVTGAEGHDPVRVSVSLIDMGTGLWAALSILGALFERQRTGQGARLSVSLLETGLSWMTVFAASYFATGELPKKLGSAMAMASPYELFRTQDGYAFICAGNDRLFARVCHALAAPGLADDPRFATNPDRVAHRHDLHNEIEAITARLPTADVVEACRSAGAPCSELNDVSQAFAHPQVAALKMLIDLPTAEVADYRAVATPISINGERSMPNRTPPSLGEHTREALAGLGLGPADIDGLYQRGIVA